MSHLTLAPNIALGVLCALFACHRPPPYAYLARSPRSLCKSRIAFSNPSPQRKLHFSLHTLRNRPSPHPLTFQLPTSSCARTLYSYTPRSIIILISPAMLPLLRISLQVMLSRPLPFQNLAFSIYLSRCFFRRNSTLITHSLAPFVFHIVLASPSSASFSSLR